MCNYQVFVILIRLGGMPNPKHLILYQKLPTVKKLIKSIRRSFLLLFVFTLTVNALAGNTKLHLATNKEHYAAAEKIHFQVFLLNPAQKVNNSVFVELVDCNGIKISKQMLPFTQGTSSGNIELPEKTTGRFYILHCYVINNDSVETSINKKIWLQEDGSTGTINPQKIQIDHFFEGGSFVAESPNNVLIRCRDENGNGVVTRGKITDGKTAVYVVFTTNSQGYARIVLNPEDKVKYQVEVQDKNNGYEIAALPMAAPAGITLNTTLTQNSVNYTVISYNPAGKQLPEYRVEALQNGLTVYDAAISFENGLSVVKETIKTESLPAGFISFRVSDKSNKIYARRVIYNPGPQTAGSILTIIDTVNNKEAKVTLPGIINGQAYINIKTGNTVAQTKNELHFLENAATDNLPVNDQLIAANELPNSYVAADDQVNRYLSIQGTLLNPDKKPVKHKQVTLVIQHKNLKKDFLVAKTDKEGRIRFDNLVFYDSVTVYYQLAEKSDDKNNVFLNLTVTPASSAFEHVIPPVQFICANELKVEEKAKPEEKTLRQVVVTSAKEMTESEKYTEKYTSGQMKRSNALRNEFDFIKNPEALDNKTLFAYLQSRMSSLRVMLSPQGNPILIPSNGGTVGVYLNDLELPLDASLDFLNNLLVKDVAQVKYYSMSFKPKLIGGNPLTDARAADGGDLLIYTKRDYVPGEEKTKGLPKTSIVGYSVQKPYSNTMEVTGNTESLFWKAGWQVETGQRIYIGLPKNDTSKNVDILIEGINNLAAPYRFTQKLVFN